MKALVKLLGSFAVLSAVCICAPGGRLLAQGLGSINGTVTDSSGAVVAGAEVTATQAATGISTQTTTSSEGTFVFPILSPSVYNVSASRAGFEMYTQNGVELRADAAVTVNISLKTGKATETVTVSAENTQIDVTTGTLSQVIGQTLVSQLAAERAQRGRTHRRSGRCHHCSAGTGRPGQYQDLPHGDCDLRQRHIYGADQLHARWRQ